MIDVYLVIWLLFAHFVADFVFQSTKTGLTKSKCNNTLTTHVCIYILVLWAMLLPTEIADSSTFGLAFACFNGMLHWPTDWLSSRLAGTYHREQRLYAFWKVIGLDQLAHTACLVLTAGHFYGV